MTRSFLLSSMDRADSSRGARGDDGPNDDGLGEIACDGAHM